MSARIVAFPAGNPFVASLCQRKAEAARDLQDAIAAREEARRRRDELLDIAAQEHARVRAMSLVERVRRARELDIDRRLIESVERSGVFRPDGPEVA